MVVSNPWWISEPEQRYWMEITDRPDEEIGTNLHCPAGPVVTDELVGYVQPGDRILHWKKAMGRVPGALVGWSEATRPPTQMLETHDGREIACFTVPLGGLTPFAQPVTSAQLLPKLDQLMDLRERLRLEHGKHVYFPFVRHIRQGESLIYAPQGYSAKFPAELFDLIPGIGSARVDTAALSVDDEDAIAEDNRPPGAQAPPGRVTRIQDPKLRAAIERRSLDVALAYYKSIRGQNPRELGKPYDIEVTVAGVERHCEVKGSKMSIDAVELTVNEVEHARNCANADLIVVDRIETTLDETTGEFDTSGGRLRVWLGWTPEDDALKERRFAYSLPQGGTA
jgi:hypothetical protein